MKALRLCTAAVLAMATMASSMTGTLTQAVTVSAPESAGIAAHASTASVTVTESAGYEEGAYAEWSAVSGASGYNVYVDGTQIDTMLVRQYPSCFRADAVGLKAGSHTMKIVPVISGKEDSSKAAQVSVTSVAHDRSGFAHVNGTASGAYNEDGTLRDGAQVIYLTESTKDTVTLDVVTSAKGATTTGTGLQEIFNLYKKGYDSRPLDVRIIGTVTDPATLENGDLVLSGSGSAAEKRVSCGITIEGIGEDALFSGFGIRVKNASNVEIRNMGIMLVDSNEGDNYSIQQDCDHIWVHHCDSFYGMAGSDKDQAKGDGALDCKKSTYITFSYNHFWDNGKCNLLGLSENTTEDLYITYHHNWYDHSDSRHPRVRFYSAHVYNNYYDGNAKYGIGSTMGSSIFAESNYFRNCKYPMLTSMQGSDVANGNSPTFSSEDGGTIKAYGNYMTGQTGFISYGDSSTDFDAYVVSSKTATVPSSVTSKQGSNTYNNFDTSSVMYKYTADAVENVPSVVTANAGRLGGGDFRFTFNNSSDDTDYGVNASLMSALQSYKPSVVAIGSGFTDSTTQAETQAPTQAATQAPTQAETQAPTSAPVTQDPTEAPSYSQIIYASPDGKGSGSSVSDPTDVLTAIKNVPAGGVIYLLEGTYKSSSPIKIDSTNNGTSGKYKTISAYQNADVVFDFSGESVSSSNYGFVVDGDYWHFYGFEVTKAGDNGMLLAGNYNVIENMVFNNNQDTGLQISRASSAAATIADWPTGNLIKNCTSKNNCDDATMENADGFAAKLTCGEGNVFDGCFSYNNSDDGWDLYAKEETGPIGVVTIKNCIAFRNGFTEDGRGYGDCDGNGFKLGGGGIGTRHIVENCLAFENLNCGFTDNNNPEFGDMKNCTAYNNNLKGAKANYMVYRCSETATFTNMMSYYNTANVTQTNAPGIKTGNDKFVGSMKNSIYYNGKYYFAQSETMVNGAKLGDVVTPADSDFITLNVSGMGTDFHKAWRNADGSPNPGGFAETASNGTYASLGYHMYNGVTQDDPQPTSPVTEPTEPPTQAPTSTSDPQASTYVHNFTVNGTASNFYTISGNLSDSKGTATYNGETLTVCLKMETATAIDFTAPSAGTLTLVFGDAASTVKVDGTKYATDNGTITVELSAGSHSITKADSANLFLVAYAASSAAEPTEAPTSAPTEAPTSGLAVTMWGDAEGDGDVDIIDVIAVNKDQLGSFTLSAQGAVNADVNRNGTLEFADAVLIMKSLVDLVTLPA
ncbi:MAG: right-handed parallel beta-helix repeat-containing protein [Oscillospiraceae bacterium]|nr:right-handed parallel beta-helix repeat-containing protein [Oscillospiraceae bacterium]